MMTIRRALPDDLYTVLCILHAAADALHERGIDQWPDGSPTLGPGKIGAQIGRGEFWIAEDGAGPVAVIAISPVGDRDFWTSAELDEPAVYLSKAAVLPSQAGRGIGAALFRWACDYASRLGVGWVRLDAWRTNTGLHDYYAQRGWQRIRAMTVPGRKSGVLFARQAMPDLEARETFTVAAPVPAGAASGSHRN
jgi:GNAT superfamily N-acetyltransferase